MDFPHAQLQAGLAATMFSPDVVPSLYGQSSSSNKGSIRYSTPTSVRHKRGTREGAEDGSEQRRAVRKRSTRTLGSFFKREKRPRSSIDSSNLPTIPSSEKVDKDANGTAECHTSEHVNIDSAETRTTSESNHNGEFLSLQQAIETEPIVDRRASQETLGKLQALSPEEFAAFAKTYLASDDASSTFHYEDEEAAERKCSPQPSTPCPSHGRNRSLHVNLTREDVQRLTEEIYNETIADVNLSLFSYWINESDENYQEAKQHIRELRLDHGYNLLRIRNPHLRQLMQEVFTQRPVEPRITLVENQSRADTAARIVSAPTRLPVATPRIDCLPPALRAERQRVITQAELRSVSLSSMASSSVRDYPPNTPDRPLPLSPRTPSSTLGSPPPRLPFGFPSPGSPLRASDDDDDDDGDGFSALTSYAGSFEDPADGDSIWQAQVADIYERVVALEGPEQLDGVIEELQGLRAMYAARHV
ncbi:hypothetical protein ACJQWK_03347 [Exserohilum turcicum]